MIARAARAPGRRAGDGLLPRRDPPLQQGPAGRAAARGRGRADDPDRRDDREPLFRGQLGAALARPDLRVPAARAGADRGAGAAGARGSRARDRRSAAGRATRRSSCWRRAPAATPGSRWRRSSGRSSGPRAARRGNEVDLDAAEDALQRKAILYDREGDRHYDYISAWIKSTRGSDPDASLYYLAAMLEGGEDPRFIARRMVILASEDIGNADPQALVVATAAAARRSTGSACPSAPSTSPRPRPTWRWRRSRTPPTSGSAAPPRTSASTARRLLLPTSRTPTIRERRSSGAARATATPTTRGRPDRPAAAAAELEDERFYEPTDRTASRPS